jgi:hypothetical protein
MIDIYSKWCFYSSWVRSKGTSSILCSGEVWPVLQAATSSVSILLAQAVNLWPTAKSVSENSKIPAFCLAGITSLRLSYQCRGL